MYNVDELYEYKNLGTLKNYVGSFSSNIDDNIEKTQKKAGMIFSSSLDRRKINPLFMLSFGDRPAYRLCFMVLKYLH